MPAWGFFFLEDAMDTQVVLAIGNPFDGLTLCGPFETPNEAHDDASENDGDTDGSCELSRPE